MSPNLTIISDGRKFMSDGQVPNTRAEALTAAEAYQRDGFDVRVVEQEGEFLVYTRRAVKELVVTES